MIADHQCSRSEYVGDSLGGRTYIDRSKRRHCSGSCLCWDLDTRENSEFVFTVIKTTTSVEVTINSVILNLYLAPLLGHRLQDSVYQVIDGFVLLKNAEFLRNRLNNLRTKMQNSPSLGPLTSLMSKQDAQVETELSLLLESFVEDYQVFQSFGSEKLYEQGILSYERSKAFQSSSSSSIIDRLDVAFHATRDDLRSPMHISIAARNGSATTVKLLLEEGYDPNAFDPLLGVLISVPLVEAIKHNRQEVTDLLINHGANVDGQYPYTSHSPLIAALEIGNTGAITKLLSHGVDLKILGKLAVADCLHFATILLEHGISADSILKILLQSEAFDKRLLCTLFDAGGDLIKFPGYKPLNKKNPVLERAAGSGGHLDDAQDVDTDNDRMKCWRLESNEVTEVSHGLAWLASCAEQSLEVGIDSHRTEELRGIYDRTRGFNRAIRTRDMESVNWHIQNGADLTLGLTAALQSHDSRILKLLLDNGAEINWVAAAKAESALMAALRAGDRDFVKSLLEACVGSNQLREIDFVLDGQTPLMVAVLQNDAHIAQILMDMGANPTFATDAGHCLTMARERGYNYMLQILLQGTRVSPPLGDSLQCASKAQSCNSTISFQSHTPSLGNSNATLRCHRSLQKELAEHCSREIQLRKLRLEFRKEHSRITACAAGVSTLKIPVSILWIWPIRPAWGIGFDTDYSKAWDSGTAVMRRLCTGKLPQSLNETIMFLAVAKAICLSGSVPVLHAWHSDFASDLARWQTLFKETDGSLSAFQQAVSSIWGIHLDKLDHVDSPDSETLAYFHELAMRLADGADLSFGLREDDHGLLASQSQSQWQSRETSRIYEEDQNARIQQESWAFLDQVKKSRDSDTAPDRMFPEPPPRQGPGTGVPTWEALHEDPKVHTFNIKATLLMAGFIFGVVLAFLLCTTSRRSISKVEKRC